MRTALIVGCEQYVNFSDTDYCYSDAITLQETLEGYLDYEKIEVKTLYVGDDVTPASILENIQMTLNRMEKDDFYIFYFAGHGIVYEEEAYLVLPNTDTKDMIGTALKIVDLENVVKANQTNCLCIFDACHSGMDKARGKNFIDCVNDSILCVFAACDKNQNSYSLEEYEQGIFTYVLCKQIKKADCNSKVYIENLKVAVCDQVEEIARKYNLTQTPTLNLKAIGNVALGVRNNNKEVLDMIEEKNAIITETVDFKDVMSIVDSENVLNSPHGISLPKRFDTSVIFSLMKNVKISEVNKITNYYENEDYETAAEKTWVRAIMMLRKRILSLGIEFVADMIGIDDLEYVANLPAYNLIILANELGFIDEIGRVSLISANNFINYFLGNSESEELPEIEANLIIKTCIKYILGFENDQFGLEFNDFRNRLKTDCIAEIVDTNMFSSCPYFFLKTTVRTLANLIRETDGIEFENVVNNMMTIYPIIWNELLVDEKYFIGTLYVKYKSENNERIAKALNAILMQVKGFDFVPENTRSSTFIAYAQKLINVHYGMNNYYLEPDAIRKLEKLGTRFPQPALNICVKAVLLVKLGNQYGHSYDAEVVADRLLDKLSASDWKRYLFNGLQNDDEMLELLSRSGGDRVRNRWNGLVAKYNLSETEVGSSKLKSLLKQ